MDAVVVTHNSAVDLAAQLDCAPLRRSFDRMVVVDNASTDASREIAAKAGVEVVPQGVNTGFAAAVNTGAGLTSGPVFAILNPDIQVDQDGVFDRLAKSCLEGNIGAVGPRLILPSGSTQDSARSVPSPAQLVARRMFGIDHGAITAGHAADVPWMVGACLVVRRTAFESIGGFDTRYPLYFEDVDFCVRLWAAGWRVVFEPQESARHEHRASSRSNWLGRAMRQHVSSAARFFHAHPDLLWRSGRRRVVRPIAPEK